MKATLFSLLFISFALLTQAQEKPKYDEALAKKLGADNYGMKTYVLVMLKTGANTTATKKETDSLFKGHMSNMGILTKENKLIVAGPMAKNDKQYRGIFILNTKSIEEAKTWLATDPAINSKLLDFDIFNWYGSAALSEYLPFHDKVQKGRF